MSKRSTRRGRQSVPSEQSQAPSKKPRVEDSNSGSGSGSGETSTVVTPIQAPSPAITRDSQHYYEDGSVVLLVSNVLFKVHASLLKARSKVFKDMLTPPPSQDDIKPEGLTDEHPIKITDVTASEFRNLLVIFYALPSDMVSLGIQGATYPVRAWPAFVSLSDVARLTKRFCMTDDEKWAASRLKFLIRSSITNIATGARGNLKDGVPAVFMLALHTPVHNLRISRLKL
ncbi:hypothetical protein FRC09_003519 [Ceratobasidium sp. 395]|nr:hypothetical protein FRC09_003519 [Ceratobasidium sp. 395]